MAGLVILGLDLGEYGEKHSVARLLGAPPGYEGHGEEGQLSGPHRRMPVGPGRRSIRGARRPSCPTGMVGNFPVNLALSEGEC